MTLLMDAARLIGISLPVRDPGCNKILVAREVLGKPTSSFPRLASFADGIFAIPATNLSSERNFNYAGLTLTDRRSRLSPDMVDDLLFVRANFDVCE
ncbi:Zinc finger BED domain-containing protein-like protein [Leptotrombidium deliense]|uniref:Zinc finger BED domain-containing protein-like protein n=1 Tax=Leptotrombidium deliense TaxID=299467 RepID=A0A443S4X3_9ACAR|nr:Zinc finger BED domain-containing protein-like protein [Leptotrombidium deliense]